jgi:hypothetical protein
MTQVVPDREPENQFDRTRMLVAMGGFCLLIAIAYMTGQHQVTPLQTATLRVTVAISVVGIIAGAVALLHVFTTALAKALFVAAAIGAGAASYVSFPINEVPDAARWIVDACKVGRVTIRGAPPLTREPQEVAIVSGDETLVRILVWGGLPMDRSVAVKAAERLAEMPANTLTSSLNNIVRRGPLPSDQIACITATVQAIETAGIAPTQPSPTPPPEPRLQNPT